MLTGVVEVGLFCGMAKAAYFGNEVSCDVRRQLMAGWNGPGAKCGRKRGEDRVGSGCPGRDGYRAR